MTGDGQDIPYRNVGKNKNLKIQNKKYNSNIIILNTSRVQLNFPSKRRLVYNGCNESDIATADSTPQVLQCVDVVTASSAEKADFTCVVINNVNLLSIHNGETTRKSGR